MVTGSASDRKCDDDSAHDVVELEVPAGAVGMSVVAIDASLGDGAIGIDRLKQTQLPASHDTIVRLRRILLNGRQSDAFEIAIRTVPGVDRRQARQTEGKAKIFDGDQPSRF